MEKRKIPMVPAPTGTPMPDKESDPERKGRLYCVYMRPWVLDKSIATSEVPHLTDLDLLPERHCPMQKKRYRLQGKQSPPIQTDPRRSFSESWTHYIRGNVVSRHACKIIVQFMAANCGKTSRVENHDLEVSGANACPTDVPNNVLQLARVHHILDQMATPTATTPAKPKTPAEDDEDDEQMQQMGRSEHVTNALKVTTRLWSRSTTSWPETPVDISTTSLSATPTQARNTGRSSQKKNHEHPHAFQSRAYISW